MGGANALRLEEQPPEAPGAEPSPRALIVKHLRAFDIPALLDVLARAGYAESDIEFRSHRTLVSHGHLVHAIDFQPGRVVVTVNLGLLSIQSPLPSFLFQAMDRLGHDALEEFLGYFDHLLLRERFAGLCPERDPALLPGGEAAVDRLNLLRLSSPSTLHWLFRHCFPEAEVRVRRTTRRQAVPSRGIQLGAVALGDGTAVGGFATVPLAGLEVTLFLEEHFCGSGVPWAVEARRRLEQQVLPALAHVALPLTVHLVLREHQRYAHLQDDSHLTYDPLVGGPVHDQLVPLFTGTTGRAMARGGK